MRAVNLETITDTQSWHKIWQLNGYNLIRAKQKLLRRRKRSLRKFLESSESRKSFAHTNLWNLANPVKTYHGIIVHPHPIDRRQNGVAERAVRRVKVGSSAVLLQSGLDETWWADSMECYCYL